jgi:catechol 2,3-dioxygenase-like lactoylglutathione lyase family enzyme
VTSSKLLAVTYDADEPGRAAQFWAGLLGREMAGDAFLPGDDTQVGLRFVASDTKPQENNYLHLHVTSDSEDDQRQKVAQALGLGGTHLDVGQLPEEGHIVLADPDGNAFCVIEAGNKFLAGCGLLGEVACDGGRAVGVFWSEALGWPLVWDQDDETAIQSPSGGTKIAWGGAPDAPKTTRNRQRFELVVSGGPQQAEIDRLTALGATIVETAGDGTVTLTDPGGNEFTVTAR